MPSIARNLAERRAKTERTLLTDVNFYHVATRKDGSPLVDMLLADRNGEDYRTSVDDPSTASDFAEIARADTISFLVDGDHLRDLSYPQFCRG